MNPRQVDLEWTDGTHPFALNIGEVRELEARLKTGIGAIYQRLVDGNWYVDDVGEIIRLGLTGGGMPAADALRMVRTYVHDRPLAENLAFAKAILLACMFGNGSKKEPVGGKAETPPTE